jgi:hypothetical protein
MTLAPFASPASALDGHKGKEKCQGSHKQSRSRLHQPTPPFRAGSLTPNVLAGACSERRHDVGGGSELAMALIACSTDPANLKTSLDGKQQVNALPARISIPLVDSKPSSRARWAPSERTRWPYMSPSYPAWGSPSRYWSSDRGAYVEELRRAVTETAGMDGVDLPRQGDLAPLVAMKYPDQIVGDAPNLFGRISRLAWNAGASWVEIADQLAVTKQAAWKRYSRRGRRVPTPPMLALQRSLEHLMNGDPRYYRYNDVSWEIPLPPLESRDGALQGLRLLNGMVQQADEELPLLAAEARLRGATWPVIASTLGIGAEAAHKRLSKQVNAIIDTIPGDAAG